MAENHKQNVKPHYRDGTAAGHKGNKATGKDAAAKVTDDLARRHRQMMDAWTAYGAAGAIPETISNDLDLPVHCVRPRAGELVKRGLLFEIGKAMGAMGHKVTAYSVIRPANESDAA